MQSDKINMILFLIITTLLTLVLVGLIVSLIFLYQKKQLAYKQKIETMELDHEKNLMAVQLEIQENTFQHIAKEIHDNINLSLTLAKLHLNTLDLPEKDRTTSQVNSSIELIGQAIENLSNISKSLNSDIVSCQGLHKAVENEIYKIKSIGLFSITLQVKGDAVYLTGDKELIVFRILQEAFNNILKHSCATDVIVLMNYKERSLNLSVYDNGIGFSNPSDLAEVNKSGKAGLKNMEIRTNSLSGKMKIDTGPGLGTKLIFHIPY